MEAETVEVVQRALSYPDRARALKIVSDNTYIAAGEFLLGVKALRKEIADTFDPIIAKAHAAHKAAVAAKKDAEAPLIDAETIVKRGIAAYDHEQETKRRELEARLREEQRRAEEDARIAEAAELEAQGETALAERVIETPVYVAPVVVPKATPKVSGIVTREVWSAQVVDKLALVRAVADGKAPLALVDANLAALNAQARSLKSELSIPGVRAICEKQVAAGGR